MNTIEYFFNGDSMKEVVAIVFGLGLMANAGLFVIQAIKIFKAKSSKGLSTLTFAGFSLLQIVGILHGFHGNCCHGPPRLRRAIDSLPRASSTAPTPTRRQRAISTNSAGWRGRCRIRLSARTPIRDCRSMHLIAF